MKFILGWLFGNRFFFAAPNSHGLSWPISRIDDEAASAR
jgi:hypothetical protein